MKTKPTKKDGKTTPKTPFFSRFLKTEKVRSGLKAGAPASARPA
jgi:hypothetical protein